ncbi:MAG: methyltransferase domain-containing protein [Alphaproteobacteria bacterium]|jgi:SAM-dependent methyltransferase|nr:methyltransferase domain-containing protein [Alphaproteobacteria bacterium]
MPGAGSAHWNSVYAARDESALTWFEARPDLSFELISAHAAPGDPILDVGGGASRLVDLLLDAGLGPVTVMDLSDRALATSRERLGGRAREVTWIAGDITDGPPPGRFAVWHDRAAFHFLTGRSDRVAYVAALGRALRPGGVAIVATFADDGPEMCSGLAVRRYSPEDLAGEIEALAPGLLRPLEVRRHVHVTPKGAEQRFQVSVLQRQAWDETTAPGADRARSTR